MKTFIQLTKKAWLFYILCIMTSFMNAQTSGCESFDSFPITPFSGPGCTGTPVDNWLDNWGVINTNLGYSDTNSQNGAGDVYLHIDDGSCSNGASFFYNSIDFAGNWINRVGGEGCFCYDFRTFHIQVGTLTPNSLRLYDGPNPQASTLVATFVLGAPLDVSRGWVRICAPIELSSGGNLPSNADGQWVINTANAADWDTLINNVGSVGYLVDVGSGNEIFGLDNICLSEECDSTYNDDPPTNEGAYCCDEAENMVANGNFEFGNVDFSSDYTQDPATLPSQYDVTDNASAFGATITDHSFCADSTAYASNDMYLLVNGLTNQPSGSQSVIWEQTVAGFDSEKEYRFCANFKNMPQCTFDVLPEITVQLSNGISQTVTINTDPSDPCDWQNLSFCFRAQDEMNFQILLNEDELGDGNDLAIDDISIQELADPMLSITVQHQGNPQMVTGSINTIATGDDILPYDPEICDEPYYWYVLTVSSFSGGVFTIDWAAPYGWGNDTMGSSLFNPSATGPNWDLTTTFPGFPFAQNTMYLVGFTTPSCCEDCTDDGFTYQLIYNDGLTPVEGGLSDEDIEFIYSWLGTYGGILGDHETQSESLVSIYPNPTDNEVSISLLNNEIAVVTVANVNGQTVISQELTRTTSETNVDVSHLSSGLYLVTIQDISGNTHTGKLVVK